MKIGFACKYVHPEQSLKSKALKELTGQFNTKTTTNAWLVRQTKKQAFDRLEEIVDHNLKSLIKALGYVGGLDPIARMYRISSDICPLYTHNGWIDFWTSEEIQAKLKIGFEQVGRLVKEKNIKISFHPGQYTVLASDSPEIIDRSIAEFEYHVDMARWMGYGKSFQDGCKINVHVGGRGGTEQFIKTLSRLTPEARNLVTVENDEFSFGLDSILKLKDHVALVLDVHHHWIHTGEYIKVSDPRIEQVEASWRGQRPTLHYSISKRALIPDWDLDLKPDLALLLERGLKKTKLRAHSDYFWNRATNRWIKDFFPKFDIMCESKMKNLASLNLISELLT